MLRQLNYLQSTNDLYIKFNYLNQFELNYSLNIYLLLIGKYLIINKKSLIVIIYLLQMISKKKNYVVKSKSNILNFGIKKKIILGYTNYFKKKNYNFMKEVILNNLLYNINHKIPTHNKNIVIGIDKLYNNIEFTYELKSYINSMLISYPGSYFIINLNKITYTKLSVYLSTFQIPYNKKSDVNKILINSKL
jgi:ribosomal protein L5